MLSETKLQELPIDLVRLQQAALIFRAINHKLRQQLLHLLHQAKSLTVTETYVKARLEQSVVSQHLAILRKAGFVHTQKKGKQIRYSVNYKRLKEAQEIMKDLLQ